MASDQIFLFLFLAAVLIFVTSKAGLTPTLMIKILAMATINLQEISELVVDECGLFFTDTLSHSLKSFSTTTAPLPAKLVTGVGEKVQVVDVTNGGQNTFQLQNGGGRNFTEVILSE